MMLRIRPAPPPRTRSRAATPAARALLPAALLALLAAAAGAVPLASRAADAALDAAATPMLWGAIRWDAFVNSSGDPGDPGQITARVLRPAIWHDRLPWYSYVDPVSGNVTFDDSAPAVIDTEIAQSVAAGIDHWAFDVYPPDSDLSSALYAYLNSSSPLKAQLFFCLLLQTSWLASGGLAAWPAKVALYAAHFARAEYRTVLGNRPLVYLFAVDEGAWGNATAGWADWADALTQLADASRAAGRGAPYVVIQTWDASQGAAQVAGINAAAGNSRLVSGLSSYALLGATDAGTPWETFAAAGVQFWDSLAATGVDVIPPVAAGWDNRPRNMTPVPWEPYVEPAYVVMPTPAQLGAFVAAAQAWTAAHAASNPARCHLLSALNEYDEVRARAAGARGANRVRRACMRRCADRALSTTSLPPSSPPPRCPSVCVLPPCRAITSAPCCPSTAAMRALRPLARCSGRRRSSRSGERARVEAAVHHNGRRVEAAVHHNGRTCIPSVPPRSEAASEA